MKPKSDIITILINALAMVALVVLMMRSGALRISRGEAEHQKNYVEITLKF